MHLVLIEDDMVLQNAPQYATTSNLKVFCTPENKPFDPSDRETGDRYMK